MTIPDEVTSALVKSVEDLVKDCSFEKYDNCEISVSIGFTGAIKGVLSLGLSREALYESHPMKGNLDLSESDLADWAGEMSNQILGRMKIKFSAYDVDIILSTPNVIKGDIAEFSDLTGFTNFSRWVGEKARIFTKLSVKIGEGVDFTKKSDSSTLSEGNAIVF